MTSKPRVGIAGYGLAGRIFHGQLLKACGFEVVAIQTKNRERINQARMDFPVAEIVGDFSQLLEVGLDLVVIATANVIHAQQAIAALKFGTPVIVDKPMAMNLAETESIYAVADTTGVPVSVFFNRIWDSDTLTIKKALAEKLLGRVFRFDSRFERFRPNLSAQSWREQLPAAQGGGNLGDLQPHLISIALELFGPAEVAFSSVRSIRGAADDDVVLVLKHFGGVDSYLSASAISGSPGPRVRVLGDEGALLIHELDFQEELLRAGLVPKSGKWNQPTTTPAFLHRGTEIQGYPGVAGNYAQFYGQVLQALEGKNEWPTSRALAISVASIIDRAREISIR
jgi:scyllo-inositol 2-dehydrogenase (NADP+)